MFEYTKRKAGELFEHPMLATLFVIAGLFLVAGFALNLVSDNVIVISFMGVYAVYAAGLGVIGYLILLFFKALSIIQDRTAAFN